MKGEGREGLDGGVDGVDGDGYIGVDGYLVVIAIDKIQAQGLPLLTQTEGPCEF